MQKLSFILNVILIIAVAGILVFNNNFSAKKTVNAAPFLANIDELTKKYPFLSKRILIENQNDILLHFIILRKQLIETVAPFGDTFAFYFEYLTTGTSIGVNEKNDFNIASLGKVPLAMAFYLNKEQNEVDLSKKVRIKPEYINKSSGSLWNSGVGTEISFEEAIRFMLEESDNTAANLLADYVTAQDYEDVYKALDIPFPADHNNSINAKGFSSIIKALYFSAVLNKEDSEKILELLTKTIYKNKLPAGVPPNITIAHKIGFWGENLYSDCGIVYIPQRPYLLCMISHSTEDEAENRMKTISAMVYKYVSEANIN